LKLSDYIADYLHAQDVPCVFEVVGGMITHLLDSLHRRGAIRIVSVHHEQAAAFAADAFARMTGVPGVALATSGPGATNLLTGIASCYYDSSPAVFLTGQVNRNERKGQRPIRQLGFQETDIVAMARPITKAAWECHAPEAVPAQLQAAFELACAGRPGPVLLDLPMDVQRAQVDVPPPRPCDAPDPGPVDAAAVAESLAALRAAQRPLILVGGGLRAARGAEPLRELVAALGAPVVHSLMAVDALPYAHPLRAGLLGTYGNRWTNLAIGRSDFLLLLGSRLDVRQTGADTAAFKGDRQIYHVDCEPGEINNRVTGCRAIHAHLRAYLAQAVQLACGQRMPGWPAWHAELAELRSRWPDTAELTGVPGLNPNELMHELGRASPAAAAFVVDVGQHQMWAGQSLELAADQRFLTSGGLGAMGFSLPAAIGAACAVPGRPTVVIAGDGGLQLNIQEFQTIVRNQLPLKIVVLDNQCHGMVRQFQQSYFEARYQSTLWGYSAPDFARVAQAYGIEAATIASPGELPAALARLWRNPQTPFLLHVRIDTFANAYPKIAFGQPLTEMEPFAKPTAMEST
jgi:acetolactate synthase-1/2/3 large subunit